MDNADSYISVTQLNNYLYYRFDGDAALQRVFIKAEISNFKFSGKHCYFSLKDETSEISAMFFNYATSGLHFVPQDGMSVQVIGKVQVYPKKGTYSISVKTMIQTGIGVLYQEYLDLKDKLQKEGLFDESKKLPIPDYPEEVAIITAKTGEAIQDIVSTFNRRFPLTRLKLYPALVQGVDAPKDLIRALHQVYFEHTCDVIIIGRGGGSYEDLSCFNSEALARTLFDSMIPTISAVGHEGDYTICDFVASFRAPTPTGAAMRLTKDKNDVFDLLSHISYRIKNAMKNSLIRSFKDWDQLNNRLLLSSPLKLLENKEKERVTLTNHLEVCFNTILNQTSSNLNHIDELFHTWNMESYLIEKETEILTLETRVTKSIEDTLNIKDTLFNHLLEKLALLNPLYVMNKGYAIIYNNEGEIVSSVEHIKPQDHLQIRMADGVVHTNVLNIELMNRKD